MRAHRPAEAADPVLLHTAQAAQQACGRGVFLQGLLRPDDPLAGQAVIDAALPLIDGVLHFIDIARLVRELHARPLLAERRAAGAPVEGIRHDHHIARLRQAVAEIHPVETVVHPLLRGLFDIVRGGRQRPDKLFLADVEARTVVVQQHEPGAAVPPPGSVRDQQIGADPLIAGDIVFDQLAGIAFPLFRLQHGHPGRDAPADVQRRCGQEQE